MKKKICSFVLIIAMLAMFVPSGLVGTTVQAATFDDINQSSVFLNQSESGPCTLYAATMMIRRAAICQGDSNWSDITPSSVKSVGWLSGSGLYYSFNYSHNGVTYAVRHTSLPGGSSNKNKLISLLAEHPEGIEIYDNSTPHAILLTDYTDGIFYCADPSYSNAAARIPISSAYKVTIENADEYWYISSPQSTLTPSHPIANLGDDFYAVILMNSVWKTIGNNNGNVEMVPEVGNASTLWHFVRQADGSYYIISAKDGKYLDVYGGPCSNGVNVQTFTGNAQDNQKWYISAEKGGYLISPKSSSSRFGYVIDINGGQSNAGTNVQVWEYNGTDAQIFAIYKGSEIYLSASTLSVNPGTSEQETIFSWENVYGENYYDLKIWNGKYWEGSAYFVALNLDNTSYSKTLPAGYYEGYVDSVNALECKMSNVVCMKIKPVVHVSREGNSYKFSWEKVLSVKNYKIEVINTDTSAIAYTEYAGENDTSIICDLDPGNYQIILYPYFTISYSPSDGSESFNTIPSDAVLFKAEDLFYSVTYDANGGINAPDTDEKPKGEGLTLTTNKPSRNGYEFIGWSTDKNATSPTYTAGATFTIDADTTLYAVWKQISSIEIVTMPDKLDYNTYELLNVSGMKLKVSYSDSSTRVITMGTTVEGGNETVIDQESGTVFSPRRLDNIGSHEVTVNYAGLTATFNVNVDDPTLISITIEKLPDKLTYNVGDTLDTTGITVYANYSRTLEPEKGPDVEPVKSEIKGRREITEGFTCTPTVLNTAGTQEITVDYYGRTASFNVTVNRVLTSVTIKTNPDKLIYTMGDTLDLTGLVLTASYNDGYTEDIASGFTCTPTELNTVGTQEITVEYEGKTTTFNVTVNKIVTSIFVMANPNKTTYSAGDTLDTTGMKLLVVYHDGSTQTIMEGFTCTPTDLTTVGTQEITAEYGGKTATFEVTVKEAYSLKASPASEQTIGEPVVLTATGGSSYRFYYEQNGKWVNIRNFSTENVCLWIPNVPRDYTIYVDIKDETGKVVTSKRIQYTVTDAYPFTLDKEGEQNVGVNMTLTAKGGSSYKFYYEYNGAWCNITSNTTGVCEWSPKFAGNYMLYVDIKDASGKVIACRTQAFKLNDPFLLANDAQSTEFSYGRTVNFTAAGGNQYKFYYEKQGEWQRVQDFSSKNTCAWTPTEAGTYNFYCDIKDASGAVVSCKRMTFNITNPYSFTADKATTQPVGTKITFTATGGYQYKFYYEKDGSWVRIQSFSTENTCSWTPTVAGRYNVYCDIADENGTVLAYKGMEFVIGSISADSYTFTTSVESPKPMNTAVTLTAAGGSSYKFYYEVGGKWATIKNFSTVNTATWTPDMIADYTLYVDIKNSSGKVVKTLSKKFSATDPYSFTVNATSPQNIGKSVKLTATGGANYKFYYQYSGSWVKIQDSTSATCNWKPNKVGEYMVYVDIKNASGAVVTCRTMKLVFNDPYRFTTSASSLMQPAGTAISLSANGGTSYKFYYEKNGAWVRIQNFSATNTCTWTPSEAGEYNVFCDIKDASGSVAVCKRITFTITDSISLSVSTTSDGVGDTISLLATGGASYKFYYEKDGNWVRIQSFSTSNTCNWKPTAAGDYVVYVDVNDANGNLIGCKGVRCVVG